MKTLERYLGCLLGCAVGEAVGVTLENMPRGSFSAVSGINGGGRHGLRPGQWADDTSMTLCLAQSLIDQAGFDPEDQMRKYCAWHSEGYMSCVGRAVGIDITTKQALDHYRATLDPYSGSDASYAAGNGSIMRLAPVPMFYAANLTEAVYYSGMSSRTTHGAQAAVDSCKLMGQILARILVGEPIEVALYSNDIWEYSDEEMSPAVMGLASGAYYYKHPSEIAGSGYVIECLEAALWCFVTTSSLQEAILQAANLGDRADTTAALCGQICGAYYGFTQIPGPWLDVLAMRDEIEGLAEALHELSGVE